MRKVAKGFILYLTTVVILCVSSFVAGISFNCDKHQQYIEYREMYEREKEYSEAMTVQVKWFMCGYLNTYRPSPYLFNGVRFHSAEIACHPYLPIGTKLLIENLTRNKMAVIPVLDRKANIGDRQILMISESAAKALDWHYDDQFIMSIIQLPPAYSEDIWYEGRVDEMFQMSIARKLRRRKW